MTGIFARKALTARGWASDVRIRIDGGRIVGVEPDARPAAGDSELGIVIPGLANAHSHAFQRVLAGHTERRGPAGKDNFWSWRSRMYSLAGQVDAAALEAIATQAYCEMVATGYTAVAEFHYLHSEPGGTGVSDAMYRSLANAARQSGIRMTYVPVLYERAGFREPEPNEHQRRFACTADEFVRHVESVAVLDAGAIGIGVHSLRAVTTNSLERIAGAAADGGLPMHIHIAEQRREVDDCLDVLGARPVEWLLGNFDVDDNWCLVHATHVDAQEVAALARSGAVACLCPSTEANLGDGLFPLQTFLESINPFEELRWLEYGQRLVTEQRNVAAIPRAETGRSLFEAALSGGARACGHGSSEIATGARADLVVLDDDSPMLAGHSTRSFLDALVFSGFSLPIDRVMVNGEWHVEEGRHLNEAASRRAYADVAAKLDFDGVTA